MKLNVLIFLLFCSKIITAQIDTVKITSNTIVYDSSNEVKPWVYLDTSLRITNLNPYFNLHEDSVLNYDFAINRDSKNYFWYLQNSPVGVRIDRNTGNLFVKADKGLFKTGRLKHDIPYKIQLGVQNLGNPTDRVDTTFTILFYSTEVFVSRLKPTTSPVVNIEEGDSVQFKVQCDEGTFPFEQISMNTSMPIYNFTSVRKCNDEFKWVVPFGIFRDNDTAKMRSVRIDFIGSDKFYNKDTARVVINIRPGINFPVRNLAHQRVTQEFETYLKYLKYQFFLVSGNVKKNKKIRTGFDIGSSTTALAGTVLSTTAGNNTAENQGARNLGRIMPSIGLTLVPIKEATAPNNAQTQNTATQLRSEVRRLDFFLDENRLNGERDPDVLAKTKRLQDELKKAKLQFVDLDPVDPKEYLNTDIDKFFNDPKVNKKYKIKSK